MINKKFRILINSLLVAMVAGLGLSSCHAQRAATAASSKPQDGELSQDPRQAASDTIYDSSTVRVMYGVPVIRQEEPTHNVERPEIRVKYGVPLIIQGSESKGKDK